MIRFDRRSGPTPAGIPWIRRSRSSSCPPAPSKETTSNPGRCFDGSRCWSTRRRNRLPRHPAPSSVAALRGAASRCGRGRPGVPRRTLCKTKVPRSRSWFLVSWAALRDLEENRNDRSARARRGRPDRFRNAGSIRREGAEGLRRRLDHGLGGNPAAGEPGRRRVAGRAALTMVGIDLAVTEDSRRDGDPVVRGRVGRECRKGDGCRHRQNLRDAKEGLANDRPIHDSASLSGAPPEWRRHGYMVGSGAPAAYRGARKRRLRNP